jgi:DNA-binding HxlR family transcriptional regulator
MRQTSFADMHCSLAHTLEVICDWWTPLILRDLFLGLDRFDDLATDLGISRNLLSTRLVELVDHGIVERPRYAERPPRDRYVLTQAGREPAPIFAALTAWGDRWATPPGGPPALFQHRLCGQHFTPRVACSHCGEPVTAEELEVRPGPGARSAPGTLLSGGFRRDRELRTEDDRGQLGPTVEHAPVLQ